MKVAIIGRSEILFDSIIFLKEKGHEVTCILTAKEAPEYKVNELEFEKLAHKLKIPFKNTNKISNEKDFLQKTESEIAISFNYVSKIPEEIIQIFPYGILNAHGGDLPLYRGNACQAWAIINGEERIGLCIHRMEGQSIDSGDILDREYLDINEKTKITEIWTWMNKRIPILFNSSINKLKSNKYYYLEKQSSELKRILRCYPRTNEDAQIFWNSKAIDILRLINACNKPYCGAFCFYNGEKVIIWDADLSSNQEIFCAIPGQITEIKKDFIDVACGEGKIRLLKIEYNSKIIIPGNFARSIRIRFK